MHACPRCINGQTYTDGERVVCLQCGHVASDSAHGMSAEIISPAILDRAREIKWGKAVMPAGSKDRIMAAVRAEAGNAR